MSNYSPNSGGAGGRNPPVRPVSRPSPAIPADRREAVIDELVNDEAVLKAQVRWWAWDAQDCAGRLAASVANTSELRAVFWVRLAGVLIDIDERMGRQAWDAMLAELPQVGEGFRAELRERAIVALEQLRHLFSQEELLYIEFQRDTHAHPYADTYRLKLNAEPTWKWKRSKIIHASVQVALLRDVMRAINQRYKEPEVEAAVDFARRAWLALSNVHGAILPLTV